MCVEAAAWREVGRRAMRELRVRVVVYVPQPLVPGLRYGRVFVLYC